MLADGTEKPFNFAEVSRLLEPGTAAIYWHLSPCALTTFILAPNRELQILPEPADGWLQQLFRFERWTETWNAGYEENKEAWRQNMAVRLEELGEILQIEAVMATLREAASEANHLFLLPHRDLHLYPLESLFAKFGAWDFTRLPSLQVAIALLADAQEEAEAEGLLSVEHPNSQGEELTYGQLQSEVVCALLPEPRSRLDGPAATKVAVAEKLERAPAFFHFAGHAKYEKDDPARSPLFLAGRDRLTVREINRGEIERANGEESQKISQKISVWGCRLVTLAACETGIAQNLTITSEYVGLASALLASGVRCVLGTLWQVEAEPTAAIVIRFHQNVADRIPPAQALAEAQMWLRSGTYRDLREFYERLRSQTLPYGWHRTAITRSH